MTTITPTTASAVSAVLRKAGLHPVSPEASISREGIRVVGSGWQDRSGVVVRLWLDLDGQRRRMAASVAEALTDAGYEHEVRDDENGVPSIVVVTGKAARA